MQVTLLYLVSFTAPSSTSTLINTQISPTFPHCCPSHLCFLDETRQVVKQVTLLYFSPSLHSHPPLSTLTHYPTDCRPCLLSTRFFFLTPLYSRMRPGRCIAQVTLPYSSPSLHSYTPSLTAPLPQPFLPLLKARLPHTIYSRMRQGR